LLSVWLAYLVLLAPNSGLLRIGTVIVADRYSLLPTAALVPLLAATIARLTSPGRVRALIAVGVAAAGIGVLAVNVASSWSLCRTWRDSFSLASHAVASGGGDSPELLTGLAWALEQRGDLEGADARFCEALRLAPLHVPAITGLGMVRLRRGRVDNAAALLAEAVRLRPGVAETHNSLGRALAAQGRLEQAAAQLVEAIRLRPDFPEARRNLAIVRSRMRRGSP
jgi:Flp pilus assembly protein TadD